MLFFIYVTYIKINPYLKKFYVGRTSGLVSEITTESVEKVLKRRNSGHHKNKDGYSVALVDKVSENKDAIRGREHLLQAAHREKGDCGNMINGISPRNPNKNRYIAAALALFGDAVVTSFAIMYFNF